MTPVDLSKLYVLTYIQYMRKSQPHTQTIYFISEFPTMKEIITRCRAFCDTMNYRFLYVTPFLSNLDDLEKAYLGADSTNVEA